MLLVISGDPVFPAAFRVEAEFADFLAQRVAVEAEQRRRAELIASAFVERDGEQGPFDFLQYPPVEPRRRSPRSCAAK